MAASTPAPRVSDIYLIYSNISHDSQISIGAKKHHCQDYPTLSINYNFHHQQGEDDPAIPQFNGFAETPWMKYSVHAIDLRLS